MTDRFTQEVRSKVMASVGTHDTAPEKFVRSILHGLGLRFRIQRKDLPGTPDIVLSKHRLVVFVHGCFWHRHLGCARATIPRTNVEFWSSKFLRNIARDRENRLALKRMGWRVAIVWECELRTPGRLRSRLKHLTRGA